MSAPTAAQPATGSDEPPVNGEFYRLVSRSGRQPEDRGPAQYRLPREAFPHIYGYSPPWDITHIAPNKRILASSPAHYTHFVIDCSDKTTRRLWERVPSNVARKWGEKAVNLSTVTVRYPSDSTRGPPTFGCPWRTGTRWCEKAWSMLIEGHATGREAMVRGTRRKAQKDGAQPPAGGEEGSLHTITFQPVELTDEERSTLHWDLSQCRPSALTLPGLKTLRGVQGAHASHINEWTLPSLERVEGSVCGVFLRSSHSLMDVDVQPTPPMWLAEVLASVLPPAEGQRGQLAGLRTIGVIQLDFTFDEGEPERSFHRLKRVLVGHRSRSITSIKAAVPVRCGRIHSSHLLPSLRALDDLKASLTPATSSTSAICRPPEMKIGLVYPSRVKAFVISLPLGLPPFPSPLISDAMTRLAALAETIIWDIDTSHLPALDMPTTAEKELMSRMRFQQAASVTVWCKEDVLIPMPEALQDLPADSHPAATKLEIDSRRVCEVGVILAAKMPQLGRVELPAMGERDAAAFLRSIGGGRKLDSVVVGGWRGGLQGVGEWGLTWGDERDGLPEVQKLQVKIAEFVCEAASCGASVVASVTSLLQLRAIRELEIEVEGHWRVAEAVEETLQTSFPDGDGVLYPFNITWETAGCSVTLTAERIDT
ncbi:unnamed protein product [Vitrella brassicaformis CCMP3155]|uniref:Uncharacterized protein n=2 Tax=Vitrella brassicaformis TaxID=1169539 RepID=A0A0G4H0G5_VITBC|nr:unnamed protein product [Vitrella brassicaformis CCMP3155]|eukprot:CEM37007.1 unnamed protein product [Vitrella brassicaformis CCMP3155]